MTKAGWILLICVGAFFIAIPGCGGNNCTSRTLDKASCDVARIAARTGTPMTDDDRQACRCAYGG